MKVIFLDIDGVLNSFQDRLSFTLETDTHVQLLKELVDKTRAKIVLTSTWRYCAYDVVANKLAKFGLSIFSITPELHDKYRGDEIRAWLKDFNVDSFVILDDESDMCEYTTTNLVQTDSMFGLQKEHVERAMEILNA